MTLASIEWSLNTTRFHKSEAGKFIIEQVLKPKETKPSIVDKQCAVYLFNCGLFDANYVGYTTRGVKQNLIDL